MTPSDALAMYQNLINENGETVLVRRYSGPGPTRTKTEISTMGFVRTYASREIIGSVVQGDQSVILLVDSLSSLLPIRTTDHVEMNGIEYSIKNPMRREVGGVLIAYELHTSG